MGQIGFRRRAMVMAVLLCALATGPSRGGRSAGKLLFAASPQTDEKTTEQAWICCREEVMNGTVALGKPNLDKASRDVRPQLKRHFVDSLKRKHIVSSVTAKEAVSESPLVEHSDMPLSSTNFPKRYLNAKRKRDSKLSKKRQEEHMKIVIAACVSTAVATTIIASLLFLCFLRCRKRKVFPEDGRKDDRPLLHLESSNISREKSQRMHSSSKKELRANSRRSSSLVRKSDKHALSSEAMSSAGGLPTVKPPPGRTASRPPKAPAPPAPSPPPHPKIAQPPPMPPKSMPGKPLPSPPVPFRKKQNDSGDEDAASSKTKLKPFFWDKVLADPDSSMVWHEIKAGSFQFNEEMMESLFGYSVTEKEKGKKKGTSSAEPVQYIQIIDSKKAQNLSILLRALNVTGQEVTDALQEGNELPVELIRTLLKMAPTTQEELKLRLYSGDISKLGYAERFLKTMVEIPFAFKRLEALLFMCSFEEEVSGIKESFATLEVACNELRHSRLFLKLLEAVLKTGNRMNDGTYRGGAHAFKLDTLLKLADVKGVDGKTTLLHFVVQEIIRSEGIRAARSSSVKSSISSVKTEDLVEENNHDSAEYYHNLGLQVVLGVTTELEEVKKAAVIDADSIASTLSKFGTSLINTKTFLNSELTDEESDFRHTLSSFVESVEGDIKNLMAEEKRIMALVKSTGDYFHGHAGKDEGLRLFSIVRDFLRMLEKACKEVRNAPQDPVKTDKKEASRASNSDKKEEASTASTSSADRQQPPDVRRILFPAIAARRMDDSSSSDDESP